MSHRAPALLVLLAAACSTPTVPIPVLDTRGDVYKTEGENDPLIYGSTVGRKTVIMLYVDFPDAEMTVDTRKRAAQVLGEGRFQELFDEQSYGKVSFDIKHVHGWRRLSQSHKAYSSKTTDAHRTLFVEIFGLYPEVDFLKYDYTMVNMPRIGNTAFGERDEIAIPYRGTRINVALNISSGSPYVLAHETGHLMGLPDLYTYGGVEGTKNPTGPWDLMSSAGSAAGFLGWHRHKLKWLEEDRKTWVAAGRHRLTLTPLNGASGISMVAVPADDPLKPAAVFVIEVAQPPRSRKKAPPEGVLVYKVDATIPSGHNAVVVYPKTDLANAPFGPGDRFDPEDAPLRLDVLERHDDGSYAIELEVKPRSVRGK